jgi:OFA family oxalate/formate antiporter-like MFS transporter
MVFVLASAVNALAAVLALFVLKPMRSRLMETNSVATTIPTTHPVIMPAE